MRHVRGPVTTELRFLLMLGLAAAAMAPPWSSLVAPRVLAAPADATWSLNREWYRANFGVGIGASGLHAADIDNDGTVEIVAAAGPFGVWANNYWYVASRRGSGYEHEWVSLPYASAITNLRVAQLDSDAPLEVLVASGNTIFIYDGATRELEKSVIAPVEVRLGLAVADIDGDGSLELVFCNPLDLFVLDLETGTLEFRGTDLGGWDVAVGQVDGDPALEIVVAKSFSGIVVDGQSRAVEWSNSSGFGKLVRVGDLDGDGLAEIVAGGGERLTVYDGDTRTIEYTRSILDLYALRVVDVDGDGALEIVYADSQWSPEVHILTGGTGVQQWSIPSRLNGVTDIAVADVDGDSVSEILWGAGSSSIGPDHLYVADSVTRTLEWESVDVSGPFYGLDHGDVDGDGSPELLYASYESDGGIEDGIFFVHDPLTKALEYHSAPISGVNSTGLWRVRSANVDADPQREIFVATSSTSSGMIICYDGFSHAEEWRANIPDGISFRSLQLADVDGDGDLEVVAGVGADSDAAPGIFVYVFGAATGALEWQSPHLGPFWPSPLSLLRVANVDADPQPEIVAGNYRGRLFVLDAVTRNVDLMTGDLDATALETIDRDGDGRAEILIGTSTGAIRVIDAATGAVLETVGDYGGQIDGLAVKDVTGDGVADYVFAEGNRLCVVSGASRSIEWSSEVLGSGVAAHDSLFVADIDGDSSLEVVVNVGAIGLMVFEVRLPDTTPPTTAISSPANGVSVAGVVAISASATDDGGVTEVEFYIDGTLRATDATEPYEFAWDARLEPAGPHTIFAQAYDQAGNVGASPTISVTLVDTTAPTSAITAPVAGSIVSGGVLVTASASDETGVTRVEFRVDGVLRSIDAAPPYSFSWDTTVYANGSHTLAARAFDAAGNSRSSLIPVTVNNPAPVITAVYDPMLRAPRCATVGRSCDSGTLLNGRAHLGPEPNQPNTIGATCADGIGGSYHLDESNDRIRVSTVDGTALAPGEIVRVEATVWAWSGYTSDRLDLYRASNATSPVWIHIATLTPTAAGSQVLSATFVLPAGALQAVRARFRWQGSAVACGTGTFNDHDDLVFAVGS